LLGIHFAFAIHLEGTVDQGNDEAASRENLKMGLTTKAIEAQKKGYHHKAIRKQRKQELLEQAVDAQEIEKTTGGKIPFDKAMEYLEHKPPPQLWGR
jgi:hypothetical protein